MEQASPQISLPDRPAGGTVLVVEDEESIGALVRNYLMRDGYRVVWVRTGEEALAELTRHPVRLVVLDIGLPGMDGHEVAHRLRQTPGLEGAWLVALTGYGQQSDIQLSLDAGFDHHVVKPADPQKLRTLLASLSHQARTPN